MSVKRRDLDRKITYTSNDNLGDFADVMSLAVTVNGSELLEIPFTEESQALFLSVYTATLNGIERIEGAGIEDIKDSKNILVKQKDIKTGKTVTAAVLRREDLPMITLEKISNIIDSISN